MTGSPKESLRPTRPGERIRSLDLLRGFALLGILIMNIQSFSMVGAAYVNPTAYGDLSGGNGWVYILSHVLADNKFMTLFAMLFGAGIVLMTSRAEARGTSSADVHYRRTLILLVIGLLHAYLLWAGDVLVTYALCALVVFPLRKLSPRTLLTLSLVGLLIGSVIFLFIGLSMGYIPPRLGIRNDERLETVRGTGARGGDGVPVGMVETDGETSRHGVLPANRMFLMWGFWRAGGLMLVGMALFKWGVLTAARSSRFYFGLAAAGLALGWDPVELRTGSQFRQELVAGLPVHRKPVQLLGKHSGEPGLPQPGDVDLQIGSGRAPFAVHLGDRTHRLEQLPATDRPLHDAVLRTRSRTLRERGENHAGWHRPGGLDRSAHRLFLVDQAVSIRACGMGLALADLWEAPTHPIGADSRTGRTPFHRFSNSSNDSFSKTRSDRLPSYTIPTCWSSIRVMPG